MRFRWLLVMCAAAVLIGLAAHLVADAAHVSPDLVRMSRVRACRGQGATCSLMSGIVLTQVAIVCGLLAVALLLTLSRLAWPSWSSLPPVLPPISLH